jgi:hypothetical protein
VARGKRHPVYLVTSVLDEATLSDSQVVEIYALRWGIELLAHVTNQVVGPFQPPADLVSWSCGLLVFISPEPAPWTSRLST